MVSNHCYISYHVWSWFSSAPLFLSTVPCLLLQLSCQAALWWSWLPWRWNWVGCVFLFFFFNLIHTWFGFLSLSHLMNGLAKADWSRCFILSTQAINVDFLVCWNSPPRGRGSQPHQSRGSGRSDVSRAEICGGISRQEGKRPGGAALSQQFASFLLFFYFSFPGQRENRVSVRHFRDPNARSHPSPFPKWRE